MPTFLITGCGLSFLNIVIDFVNVIFWKKAPLPPLLPCWKRQGGNCPLCPIGSGVPARVTWIRPSEQMFIPFFSCKSQSSLFDGSQDARESVAAGSSIKTQLDIICCVENYCPILPTDVAFHGRHIIATKADLQHCRVHRGRTPRMRRWRKEFFLSRFRFSSHPSSAGSRDKIVEPNLVSAFAADRPRPDRRRGIFRLSL